MESLRVRYNWSNLAAAAWSAFLGCRVIFPSYFICFPWTNEVAPGASVSFLVGETWYTSRNTWSLISTAESFPSERQGHIRWFVWGACELNMTLGSLSADWQGYVPVLLVVWQEVTSMETCQQSYEQGSWCWYEYFWEHMHWLISPSPGNLCPVQCPTGQHSHLGHPSLSSHWGLKYP